MLDRTVLIHLKLIDLPVRLPHGKSWVTVLYDLPSHLPPQQNTPNRREPASAPISDHPKEIPSRQSLLTDQWRLAACGPSGCIVHATQKSIFNLGVNCVQPLLGSFGSLSIGLRCSF